MSWFNNLRIGSKFNIIASFLLISLLVVAALLTYNRQKSLVLRIAIDNARGIAKQIVETRDYMSDVVRGEPDRNYALVPQVVATQMAKRITEGSKYYVRQISLRYRNPENRPNAYETAVLQQFAAGKRGETAQVVTEEGVETFHFLLPMVAEKSCLTCHGIYDQAPAFVRARFPRGHFSYNYRLGEVIGAVSVTLPMQEIYREVGTTFRIDLFYRAIIFLIIVVSLSVIIRRIIIRPIEALSSSITRVTRTGNFSERLPQRSQDEIGLLINAFNNMMEELGRKTLQSRESEERYRKFIEMARSAVVTFMEDGKIIISNQRAEELLGIPRQDLLGENFFSFIVDGEALKDGIRAYVQTGKGQGVGDITRCRVRNAAGGETETEIALSVSESEGNRMFTAILREPGEK